MKLLILTQKVNIDDPILGFFHRWIEEFSRNYEKVNVICLEKGNFDLPKNVLVHSLGKEEWESKIKYILRFYKYIWVTRKDYDVVFVHMNPIYILLGGLFWRLLGKKVGLWYVHRQKSISLWLSTLLAGVIFSSTKESFGYASSKINYLGHGIDISKYSQTNLPEDLPKDILYIGRITPIKNIETLIGAIEILNYKFPGEYRGMLVGKAITPADEKYKKLLEDITLEKKIDHLIDFVGAKKSSEVAIILDKSWATVNCSPTGGMDKAVLESLASNRPVFASNLAFRDLLGKHKDSFLFNQNDPEDLTKKIEKYRNMPNAQEIVRELSDKVRKEYDVTNLIGKVTNILNG